MRLREAPSSRMKSLQQSMRFFPKVYTVVLLFAFLSCNETSFVGPRRPTVFTYTGYDSSGITVLIGSLELIVRDSAHVTGNWEFIPLGNPQRLGPQVGKGKLLGAFFQGSLFIELNPDMVDNNVSLTGSLQGGTYQGTWTWTGFAGPMNRGTFKAVR